MSLIWLHYFPQLATVGPAVKSTILPTTPNKEEAATLVTTVRISQASQCLLAPDRSNRTSLLTCLAHSRPRRSSPHRAESWRRRQFYVLLCPLIRPPEQGKSTLAQFVTYVLFRPDLGYRTSIVIPSTKMLSKTRTARSMSVAPAVACLHRRWAAQLHSKYAFQT